ncbi:MAG: YggS family pyridoxal phosphate-dependent enzyme [Acidobacteriia bacterium]|nr:YggS family pyridoxal phosphate-dependent enzyme [Terriglobia bacterium]
MAVETSAIAVQVARVRERVARAAKQAGRDPAEITLVAVSKTFPASAIREAYAAGVRHFGENRVQEWEAKRLQLNDLEATWHLVGHLQTNKARRAVRLFHTVDSLDSIRLAEKLEAALADLDAPTGAAPARMPVLLEVRLAPEETKHGVEPEALPALAEAVLRLPHLELRGLMCIPPWAENPEQVRPYFRQLRQFRDRLEQQLGHCLPELSMGMSHDFEVAITEGATQIRLGTAIFGARD